MPVVQGEVKQKIFSILADSIDVLRLYQSAVRQVEAQADEIAILKDRCDVLERSFGDTAALEHTVTELQERNDQLRMRLDVINSKPGGNWKLMYETARQTLGDVESETNWLMVLDNRLGQLVEMHEDEPPPASDTEEGWKIRARSAGQNALLEQRLAAREAELEKYRRALQILWGMVKTHATQSLVLSIQARLVDKMKEEGYDIEEIEGFGSSGSEDNTEGKDEHDFL